MKRTLKGIRADLGLTQSEMAEKLGISEVAYRNKELYKAKLFAVELLMISKLSGVRPEDIKVI